MAVGWLGWSPALALYTPIPQILLAIQGKAEFVAQSNPFGSSKPRKKTDEQKLQDQRNLFARMRLDAAERQRAKKVKPHGK